MMEKKKKKKSNNKWARERERKESVIDDDSERPGFGVLQICIANAYANFASCFLPS